MEFEMSNEFATKFGFLKPKNIIFKTHEQLDKFVSSLLEKDVNFPYSHKVIFF